MMAALSPGSPSVRVGFGKPNSRRPRRERLTEIKLRRKPPPLRLAAAFPPVSYRRCGVCDKVPRPQRPHPTHRSHCRKNCQYEYVLCSLTKITGWSAREKRTGLLGLTAHRAANRGDKGRCHPQLATTSLPGPASRAITP